MKRNILTSCLLAVGLTMAAQGFNMGQVVTTGQVVDAAGNPISGARVEAKGTKIYATTGIDGRFILETPKVIEKVRVSSAGRQTKVQEVSNNMSIQLVNATWWTRAATRYQFFVSPQVTIPSLEGKDTPFGVMVGVVKNVGVYARYVQSSMPSTSMEIDDIDRYNTYYWTDVKTGYQAITGGLIIRLGGPIYYTMGGGIVHRKVAMEHLSGKWIDLKGIDDVSYSYEGFCAELGLMMKFGHVTINGGSTLWNPGRPCFGANFGIGYMF